MTSPARLVCAASFVFAACAAPPISRASGAVDEVARAASAFLAALPGELRPRAERALDDPDRTRWAFVPGRYAGIEFGDLDATSMACAHELLHALLSASGYAETLAIVALEDVLHDLEGRDGHDVTHRDPRRYTLLVCGDPTPDGAFAVRMQGHHVSLHFTFADGRLVGAMPHFLGSNPHERRDAPHAGERVLAAEEDLARALLTSLDPAQRAAASVAERAPADVQLGPAATFAAVDAAEGLPASRLTAAQRDALWQIVEHFAHHLRGEFAAQELARLASQRDSLHFIWAGGVERGQGHYWRVQGETFAIEYDNTQNDANHVHCVWRDRDRDFGADPLREHLARDHAEAH